MNRPNFNKTAATVGTPLALVIHRQEVLEKPEEFLSFRSYEDLRWALENIPNKEDELAQTIIKFMLEKASNHKEARELWWYANEQIRWSSLIERLVELAKTFEDCLDLYNKLERSCRSDLIQPLMEKWAAAGYYQRGYDAKREVERFAKIAENNKTFVFWKKLRKNYGYPDYLRDTAAHKMAEYAEGFDQLYSALCNLRDIYHSRLDKNFFNDPNSNKTELGRKIRGVFERTFFFASTFGDWDKMANFAVWCRDENKEKHAITKMSETAQTFGEWLRIWKLAYWSPYFGWRDKIAETAFEQIRKLPATIEELSEEYKSNHNTNQELRKLLLEKMRGCIQY